MADDRHHETLSDKKWRLLVETATRKTADRLKEDCLPGTGFALFMFDFGDDGVRPGGAVAYVANGDRAGVIRLLKDWLRRQGEL